MSQLKLDNKSYQYEELAKKYNHFHRPLFKIVIDGKEIMKEGVGVSSISINTSIERKSESCVFTINNGFDPLKRNFRWVDDMLVLGKKVDVSIGYFSKLELVFTGIISSVRIDYHFESIEVTALDISFLMMRGTSSTSWEKKKHSDIVSEIAKKYTSYTVIDPTSIQYNKVTQDGETDYQFINRLAIANNYDFFVIGNYLYFRKPLSERNPVVTLEYGENLHTFSIDADITKQVSGVVVRSWNHLENTVIEGKATKINKLGTNSKTGVDIMNSLGKDHIEYVNANVESIEEAKSRAEAILNNYGMLLLRAEGECVGIPEIRAGRYMQINGVGQKYSQLYYITSANHFITESGYITSFTLGGNAV